jgi:hypothetical protein
LSVRCVSYIVTVVGVRHSSVEIMVNYDVLVMVTVLTITFEGNAIIAVKINAIVKLK